MTQKYRDLAERGVTYKSVADCNLISCNLQRILEGGAELFSCEGASRERERSDTPRLISSSTGGVVTERQRTRLLALQGQPVTVALRNGTRIDDARLVSACCGRTRSLWLFDNGADRFVALDDVLELWDECFQAVS